MAGSGNKVLSTDWESSAVRQSLTPLLHINRINIKRVRCNVSSFSFPSILYSSCLFIVLSLNESIPLPSYGDMLSLAGYICSDTRYPFWRSHFRITVAERLMVNRVLSTITFDPFNIIYQIKLAGTPLKIGRFM